MTVADTDADEALIENVVLVMILLSDVDKALVDDAEKSSVVTGDGGLDGLLGAAR